jgi:hypothetical protein
MFLRIDSTPYPESYPSILCRRYHQLHYVMVRRIHDAFTVHGHNQITGIQSAIEIGRSTGNNMTNRDLLTVIFFMFLLSSTLR